VQADFAIFSIGGVTVPIYPSYPPDLVAYVINDSGARTVFVEDAAQLAKVLEAREQLPQLEHIVVMGGYEAAQPPKSVMTWATLQRIGRENAEVHKSTLAERVASTMPADVASIVYTSGTTGPPKGVVQTHGNHIAAVTASTKATPVQDGWVHLLFLPLAHSFARMESFLGIAHGMTTAFAENLDKLRDNLPGPGRRRSGRSSTGPCRWAGRSAVTSSGASRCPPGSRSSERSRTSSCSRSSTRGWEDACNGRCRAGRRWPAISPSSSTPPESCCSRATG
jgi:hypothetical protein